MTGARFRTIGLTLLTGAALAVACGGDDSGDDDDDGTTGTPTSTTGTPTSTTTQTQSATSTGTTGSPTGSTTGSTTGTGGSTSTGAGGSAGGGGECMDEGASTTDGGAGEGGGAGAAGAPAVGGDEGYLFSAASEVEEWNQEAADTCEGCGQAALSWSCAVMEVSITWPTAANAASHNIGLENVVGEDALRDLSGRTVMASIRMTSPQRDSNGYDVNISMNDFGDGSDWTYYGTCWSGEATCPPERHSIELWADDPAWSTISLPADAEDAAFDSSNVRKLALQIATKFWEDAENPPTFSYDSAPTTFEIGMYVW